MRDEWQRTTYLVISDKAAGTIDAADEFVDIRHIIAGVNVPEWHNVPQEDTRPRPQ